MLASSSWRQKTRAGIVWVNEHHHS
jgi:hypothetical protein